MSFSDVDAGGADFTLSLKDDLTRDIQKSLSGAHSFVANIAKQIDSELKSISQSIQSTGKQLAAIGAGVTAVGATSVFSFSRAVRAAGNFAETVNMFEAVFKSQSGEIRAWGQEYGKTVGRAEAQMLDFLAQSQDTFVPLGFDRREAAELSKTVTKLAIDLGSFKNIDDGESLRRLLGGLVGNTENLKAFGVQATAAAIKAKALSLGFDPKNLTSYQKALSILEITIDGTRDAQGDAAKTSGEYVNSIKAMKAELSRFAIAVGEPIKAAVTGLVRGFTFFLSKVNEGIEAFPILSQVAAGISVAFTAVGAALTAVGVAIAAMGSYFAAFIGLGLLSKIGGGVGFVANQILSLKSVISGLALKAVFTGIAVAVKASMAVIATAIVSTTRLLTGFAARFAIALVNPWTLLIVAITSAIGLAEKYYKGQQDFEKQRGKELEQDRQRIAAQSFRDAGQPVPADLSKTFADQVGVKEFQGRGALDFWLSGFSGKGWNAEFPVENPAQIAIDTMDGALSSANQELAEEIKSIRSSLEKFRERMEGAQELLKRGTIDQSQFERFAKQELDNFRSSDPVTQARESLREQLMTPIERFNEAIGKAEQLFANDPTMFARAREAAIEQFKANDVATQMAEQLQTPLERFNKAVAKAKEVFANSPEMLSRALKAAGEQLKAADPIEQLRDSLRTPIEIYRDGLNELKEIIAGAVPEVQADLFERGKKQLEDRLNQSDPDRQKAKSIQESLLNAGEQIAKKLGEAFDLVSKGLLTEAELEDFRKSLIAGELGERPKGPFSQSLQTTNANIASQLGSFGPTFDRDNQVIEFHKKEVKLQGEIKKGIDKLVKKKGVLGR